MSSEKMMILKMLEEGKITAENAAKLLASLGGDGEPPAGKASPGRGYGSQTKGADGGGAAHWTQELGKKIEVIAKDLEPKIQKLAGIVVEKSAELTDSAAKGLQNASQRRAEKDVNPSGKPANAGTAAASPGAARPAGDKTLEQSVSPGLPNEILLKSPKGGISVKGYNGDKATLTVRAGQTGGELSFLKLGYVYQLNYNEDAYESISVDAFLPASMFKRLTVETADGDVTIDNVEAEEIIVNTSKCQVAVKNVRAARLKIDNLNGAVLLGNSSGDSLTVENANGAIDASNADFKTMRLETTSEPVSLVSQGFYKYEEYDWVVRTSNARLKVSLPVSAELGYDIRAYTSLSDVSSGLTGIVYTRNDRNCVEGRTDGYDAKPKKARLELDTSNAPLSIN